MGKMIYHAHAPNGEWTKDERVFTRPCDEWEFSHPTDVDVVI